MLVTGRPRFLLGLTLQSLLEQHTLLLVVDPLAIGRPNRVQIQSRLLKAMDPLIPALGGNHPSQTLLNDSVVLKRLESAGHRIV